jgi:TRAP-type C4-dicarboxylate transport system permease small subunit
MKEVTKKLVHYVDAIETAIGPFILLIIFLDVILQVMSRTLPGNAIPWTVELGEILLGALIWLGIGVGITKNSHVSFDLLLKRFPKKWQRIACFWNINLFIGYLFLLAVFTVQLLGFYQKLSAKSTILQIGMFWIRLPILIGCALTIIRLIRKELTVVKDKTQTCITEHKVE